ncbi:MAG: hypothetical protein IT378_12825 [Sandaracinaceae bacterium]|nr:hypothetical protein [Sandaracinaceae bacterium]
MAAILSVGLHGAAGVAMLFAPSSWGTGTRPGASEVSIEIINPLEVDLPEPPAPPPQAMAAAAMPAPIDLAPRPGRPSREPSPSSSGSPEPQQPEPVGVVVPPNPMTAEPTGRELTPEEQRRVWSIVNPQAAARGAIDYGPGPSRPGPPAGLGAPDARPSDAELSARLGQGLRAQAMAKQHISRPARPELSRRPDGSYAYAGHRFEAVIQPDGRVQFNDRPGISTNGFSTSGSFDLTDAIMGSAGQDPHRAERDWFMRHTEELRDRLEAEHRERTMQASLQTLRGRLARVWASESRSYEARRRRIFDMYNDCDDGGDGEGARRAILSFIRTTLPRGSPNAYTVEEIERFNALRARESRPRFEPY